MELSIKDLSFAYIEKDESKLILDGIDLRIDEAGIYTIEGENGSGKTTLMKLLSTLLVPQKGCITLNGYPVGQNSYKKEMGFIPDNPILFENLTGEEHISIFYELWELTTKEKKEYIDIVREYAEVLNLADYFNQNIRTLSLGTRYKLFYILMLARKPKLLLLDEPFSCLDFNSQDIAKNLLVKHAKNAIVIICTHQKELITELSKGRFVINGGKLSEYKECNKRNHSEK